MIGLSRPLSAKFSFFVAIPIMLGASLLKLFKLRVTWTLSGIIILVVGMISSFIVSIIAIKKLITYVKENDFKVFGYYRIALGAIVLAALFMGVFK